jgi:large subunit ribosomal protein L35
VRVKEWKFPSPLSPPTRGGDKRFLFFQEKEEIVPKLKTNRGAAKRFKKTGTGKVKAKRAFARHILTKKSASRKRSLRRPKMISKTNVKGIEKLIPYL